jgi:hypothetical protein
MPMTNERQKARKYTKFHKTTQITDKNPSKSSPEAPFYNSEASNPIILTIPPETRFHQQMNENYDNSLFFSLIIYLL